MSSAVPAFTHAVQNGPLIVAALVAMLVGVVGFLSPCVLPLVPGFLSYVASLSSPTSSVADEHGGGTPRVETRTQTRVVVGAALFVVGFSAIFIAEGVLFGRLGEAIRYHTQLIERILGAVIVMFGLSFLGLIPVLQREYRIHRLPPPGLLGAPLLGAGFGLAWTPCLPPTLSVVYSMSYIQGSAARGSILMAFYCLGLGLPFILVALGLGWVTGALGFVRRHRAWVSRLGGGLLLVMGVLLLTGAWDQFADWLRQQFGGTTGVGSGL